MSDTHARTADPGPAHPTRLLADAINHLSLGLIIFDAKREVVFCNTRYMEIYRLSPEQVKPGTPIGKLIQHRLNQGLKVRAKPEDYVRQRVEGAIVADTTLQEFTDGRVIAYTVNPMPGGGGMATHEDITGREESASA
jgi:PAS domain-containing protein